MDPFIKVAAGFMKLTMKIIEGAIRAVLETAVEIAAVAVFATTGLIFSFVLVRYGNCVSDEFCSPRCVGSVLLVAGWALLAFATYSMFKRMP